MTIAYRPAEPDDAPFVVSNWCRAFKPSRSAGMIASEDWETVMHPQVQKLLNRPNVRTIIAYENTDPSFLYGFIAGDPDGCFVYDRDEHRLMFDPAPVVYFTYVKENYRKGGYARGLFATLGVDPSRKFFYTCWVPILPKLYEKIPLAKHDPSIARYPKPDTKEPDRWKP